MPSSGLSVSSGFGTQFFNYTSDISLTDVLKDSTEADVSSLMDIHIQQETPQIQSPSVQKLRVAKLEKDVSELKNINLSAEALTTKHSEDLIQKHSVKPAPELSKIQNPTVNLEQGSEKSASEILKIKREQAEKNPTNHKLYHALMEALIEDENAIDKGVADTVKDHKRKHDDDDPPARPNQGKAPSKGFKTGKSASAKEPVEEPIAEVVMDDAGEDLQPPRPPTPDPEWNKRQVVLGQLKQPWFNQMVSATNDPLTFNDPMATPIDFYKYVLNRLKIDNLTQDLLLGHAYNLLKDKLNWNNPEGDRYPFDMSKPIPLQGHPGHLTVGVDYFFNNDLEYLKSFDLERMYTTSIMKTKEARYEIVRIEDMVPRFGFLPKLRMTKMLKKGSNIRVKGSVSVKKLHGYGHLEEIVVKRVDRQLYKFRECKFVDLHLNDIEDMLLLAVQTKLFHIKTLGVESYQKKLNITAPHKTFPEIEFKEIYTPSYNPPGVIYEDLNKQKRVMWADELYKFSDETLKKVRDKIHHRVLDFHLGCNNEMLRRKWTAIDRKRSQLMVELMDKQMRERRIIRNLERLVGARELEKDYKLMTRTV
ncbi:hypothetical protein Tco_0073427 [Tanacetum coccineum]